MSTDPPGFTPILARLNALALVLIGMIGLLSADAVSGMGQDKKKDSGVQPDGLKNLKHPDANIRYRTAALLAKQGPLAKFAIEELREALQDSDPLVRIKVAEA